MTSRATREKSGKDAAHDDVTHHPTIEVSGCRLTKNLISFVAACYDPDLPLVRLLGKNGHSRELNVLQPLGLGSLSQLLLLLRREIGGSAGSSQVIEFIPTSINPTSSLLAVAPKYFVSSKGNV